MVRRPGPGRLSNRLVVEMAATSIGPGLLPAAQLRLHLFRPVANHVQGVDAVPRRLLVRLHHQDTATVAASQAKASAPSATITGFLLRSEVPLQLAAAPFVRLGRQDAALLLVLGVGTVVPVSVTARIENE